MGGRRWALLVMALGMAVAVVAPSTVTAAVAVHSYQTIPVVDWITPGPDLDGLGQWVYVAPIPQAGPGQIPTTGYVYGPSFVVASDLNPGGIEGTVGLSTDDQGPIAGIQSGPSFNAGPVIIRYDWSPGKFYFLFVHHLGDAKWGGWVYDDAAATWTFIGSVQSIPSGQKLRPFSGTAVLGSEGLPVPAFDRRGYSPIEGPCTMFPRVDAYFLPTVAYRGNEFTASTLDMSRTSLGNCATETTFEQGWAHFRLGSLAAA